MCYYRRMDAVVDSSTLISLAWAGILDLIGISSIHLIVPSEVYEETVGQGRVRGHVDAAAIESAVASLESRAAGQAGSVDAKVLNLGREVGLLITNDVALGRRAANLGIGWLRTADLVVACARLNRIPAQRARAALQSLHDTGRITQELLEAYRRELA